MKFFYFRLCRLIKIPQDYYPSYSSFQIGREYPFIEKSRIFMIRMRTTGYLSRGSSSRVFSGEDPFLPKRGYDDSKVMEISIGHVYLIFLGYSILLLISTIILTLELKYFNSFNR